MNDDFLASPARRRLLRGGAALAALASTPTLRAADAYPSHPLRLIVPFAAAGSADVLSRVLAQAMAATLGQNIVIDNRGGAGGALGLNAVAHAEPDGYVLGTTSLGPQILLPAMGRKLPYDPARDFTPIGFMGGMPLAIIGNNALAPNSLAELVALAKSRPGKLTIGSSGVPGQVAIEQFKRAAGIDIVQIPYKGDAPLATDLMGGHIDLAMITVTGMVPYVSTKSFKTYASTGVKRADRLPAVATVAELGYPGFQAEVWYVLTAPAGTPPAAIATLSAALTKALDDPKVNQQFVQQNMSKRSMDPAAAARFVADEARRWGKVVAASGLHLDD